MRAPQEIDLCMLRELSTAPATSQRSLASRLGVSLGRVNYSLRALTDKGWIKAKNFRRSDNKWAYAYVLTPAGAEEKLRLTLRFLQQAMAEYDRLSDELAALRRELGDSPQSGLTRRIIDAHEPEHCDDHVRRVSSKSTTHQRT
jgi:EPS-associated MarR family transcriptional regulator